MISTEIKELYKGRCDRCAMLPPRKYALVFPDNGEGLEDKPQLWCFDLLETKSIYKIK